MRFKVALFIFAGIITLCSCEEQPNVGSIDGYKIIEKKLIDKFGANAYYTDLSINQQDDSELTIDLLVTKNPDLYQMQGWSYSNGIWTQVSTVSLELTLGNIEEYMFKINNDINIVEAAYLVNLSIEKLRPEQLKRITLKELAIRFPDDGDKSKMRYDIELQSDSGKIFTFLYDLEGNLVKREA